ncbi:MAG: hypothetical protein J0J06_04230 [Sphingomonas sp.]|uniref:hypothetical protein n=1 Tax=Sphingomonas sp. TaxID=28214 RepID=UPI001ACFE7A3|nr:hypothetical protein [Sphingomonas sp.]MBN8814639.1 hypothetical protein [Sphingomonas sp.]
MATSRVKLGLSAVALLAVGGAAIAQQKPESILPPGFDQPPAAAPRPAPTRAAPAPVAPSTSAAAPVTAPAGAPTVAGVPGAPPPVATPTPAAVPTDPVTGLPIGPAFGSVHYSLPDASRRSLGLIGIQPADGVINPAAFGNADGRYIEALMRRTRAPIASRWVSIALRRLLAQPLATPRNVNGADFAAERAFLLLRMGESVIGRAIVQSVDPDNYTPKLYQVAMQAALATGDVGAMCPLAASAVKVSDEPAWVLGRAMCASLSSSPSQAKPLMQQASRVATGIDLLLAQKVAGQGANRQDVTIEWGSVAGLNSWRYGLAIAAGEDIPDSLFAGTGPQMRYWQALSPRLTPAKRAPFADLAAAQGVLSAAALVDLYGLVDASDDTNTPANAVAKDLANAYAASNRDGRLDAIRQLWKGADAGEPSHYGRLVLTARAVARIPVAASTDGSDDLIASMLSAGMDGSALRWRGTVARGSIGWALIALSDPNRTTKYAAGDVEAFSASPGKQKMFAAGLAGLGRIDASAAQSSGVDVAGANSWTRAIDRAAAEGRPGEVLVLSAVGMQTTDWRSVSPQAVYHIVNALRVVGLEGWARMVAAEAVTRV